jgi:hypothetical protein
MKPADMAARIVREGGAPTVARGDNLFVAVDDKRGIMVAGQVARARTQ